MKKILGGLFLTATIIIGQTFAFTSNNGNNLNITLPINDDYYIAGDQIMVDTSIMGDIHAFGNTINIGGNIEQDCVIVGNEVIIRSQIGDDCRILANNVKIFNNIKGDLLITANHVEIANNIEINGDAIITADTIIFNGKVYGKGVFNASKLVLNGQIMGNTFLNIKSYVLGSSAKINGTLNYTSDTKIPSLENLTNAPIVREESEKNSNIVDIIQKTIQGYAIWNILFLTIFGSLGYFLFESTWLQAATILRNHSGKSFLTGLVVYAVLPLIIAAFSISIIGIPFALLLGSLYVFLLACYELFIVIMFTALASSLRFTSSSKKHLLAKGCMIISLAGISTVIIGIDSIAACFAVGSITLLTLQFFKFLKLK